MGVDVSWKSGFGSLAKPLCVRYAPFLCAPSIEYLNVLSFLNMIERQKQYCGNRVTAT